MKKTIYLNWIIIDLIFLFVLCLCLSSCGADKSCNPGYDFPLNSSDILEALTECGIEGVISDTETTSYKDGHTLYVVRNASERYNEESQGDMEENPGSYVMIASVSSAEIDGERFLQVFFDSIDVEPGFRWEQWEKDIEFAAVLYGGFEDQMQLFDVFSEMPIPEGDASYIWDHTFPSSHCEIEYYERQSDVPGKYDHSVKRLSGTLAITIRSSGNS